MAKSSETVVIYHNPRCGKSRQTLALIEETGISPEVVLYLETPLSEKTLNDILKKLALPASALVRTKEAKEEGFDPASLSEAALVKALAAHPRAIERPIVVRGGKAVLGRPPENVKELL